MAVCHNKLIVNKILFSFVCLVGFLCFSCTHTEEYRKKSEISLNKGISYIEMGQYNNAIRDLLDAKKYNSSNPKVYYFLGMSYHRKGLMDMAIEAFQEAISLDENYSEAHNYLGTVYAERQLWDKAIGEYEKALSNYLYDTPSFALYNMAWAYYSKKDYKTALIKYQEALNLDQMTGLRPQIEKNVGIIYLEQNKISDAISHFQKAVELDPSIFDAHFLLGQCYLKIHDNKNAKTAFQEVIKLAPESSFSQRAKKYLQSLN